MACNEKVLTLMYFDMSTATPPTTIIRARTPTGMGAIQAGNGRAWIHSLIFPSSRMLESSEIATNRANRNTSGASVVTIFSPLAEEKKSDFESAAVGSLDFPAACLDEEVMALRPARLPATPDPRPAPKIHSFTLLAPSSARDFP